MKISILHKTLFFILLLFLPTQLGRHFWPEWSYVMGLRVDYLSPTIYLTDILVFLILGIWGIENIRNVKRQMSNVKSKSQILKFSFFFTAVFIFLLVNCFFAQNQGAAVYKLVRIIEFFLLGFYIAKNTYTLDTIRRALPWMVVYSSLIAFAQFLKQSSLGGVFWWLGERTFNAGTPGIAKIDIDGRFLMRPYATFSHPNVLAGFILVNLVLILTRNPRLTIGKLVNSLAFILGLIIIFISFSRSTWLVGLLIGLWLLKNLRTSMLRVTGYGLSIFLLVVLLIKLPNFPEESFVQRIKLGEIAVRLIKQNPLIGVGLNNFVVNLPKFQQGQVFWLQPVHNIYLLVAAETGMVGLLIFLWFLFLTFRKLLYSYTPLLLYPYVSILLLGLFDHYWLTLQQTQLLFAIVLGLIWGNEEKLAAQIGNKGKN